MVKIIALSGRKSAGKSTLCKFIRKYWCELSDRELSHCTPHIDECSFADRIKNFCINTLGLTYAQCYGTDEQKNTLTRYKWDDVDDSGIYPLKSGYMTAREVMQYFGTDIIRYHFGNVWAKATLRFIYKNQEFTNELHIITDNRFPDETTVVLNEPYGYVIRLTRAPFPSDSHESETALDDFDWDRKNCFVIDNSEMTMEEKNETIIPILERIYNDK